MLGDLIAGSPREMNYSEILLTVLKSYRAMSRFLVNNFCTYCSNLETHRRGMFIWSNLRAQNLSEMDVRAFARIKKVIWDQLLATKAEIIQS